MAITKPDVLPTWAESGDKVQPSDVEIQNGWPLTNVPPSRQRFNWFFNYVMNGVRYFSRRGLPDWDSAETYEIGDTVIGSDDEVYRALTGSNLNNNPTTSPSEWRLWQSFTNTSPGALLGVQVFNSSGTYTPTAGTNRIIIEMVGGGGASGGVAAQGAGQSNASGGAGSGAYAKAMMTSGFSGQGVTVGAAGIAASGANGGNGGASAFGAFVSAPGGLGSTSAPASGVYPNTVGGAVGGSVATVAGGAVGLVLSPGNPGQTAYVTSLNFGGAGYGAPSVFGGNGSSPNNGSGATGVFSNSGAAVVPGNNGSSGRVVIYEYA